MSYTKRRRRSAEAITRILKTYDSSRENLRAFADREGVPYATAYGWLRRERERTERTTEKKPLTKIRPPVLRAVRPVDAPAPPVEVLRPSFNASRDDEGKIAARCFDMFNKDYSPVQVVIATTLHPSIVLKAHELYVSMRARERVPEGGVVLSAADLAMLASMHDGMRTIDPVASIEDLIANVRATMDAVELAASRATSKAFRDAAAAAAATTQQKSNGEGRLSPPPGTEQ